MTGRLWWPAALLLGAVALRVWSAAALLRDLRVREPVLDGLHYLELAQRLARGEGWPAGPIFMTPFYPAVLSALFRAGAPPVPAVVALQTVLGIATLVLLFFTVRRDLGAPAAWGAAALFALCGPAIAMESQVLTESLLLFLAVAAVWLWPRAGRPAWGLFAFGIVAGLLTMGRGVFLLLPAAALGLWWWRALRGTGERGAGRPPRSHGRTRDVDLALRATAAVAAGVLLALLPLAVHQTRATGRLTLLTLNGGLNLYLGNNPWARGLYSLPPGIDLEADPTAARSASMQAGREMTLAEADRFWARRAVEFLTDRPGRALGLLGRKALLYLSPEEIPQIETYALLRRDVLPLRFAVVDFRWILPAFGLGLAAAWSRRRHGAGRRSAGSDHGGGGGGAGAGAAVAGASASAGPGGGAPLRLEPYLLLVAVGWIATIAFFATGRYRIPFLAGFLGPAGLGLAALIHAIRARRPRPALIAVPVIVAVQALLPGYAKTRAEAHDAYQIGIRLARTGKPAEALEAYRTAARLAPEEGMAWHGIGAALVKLGRPAESVEAFRTALERMPNSPVTHYNLGAVYGRLGDDAAALAEFRRAVEIDPYEPSFRSDLGVALARTGRTEEAIAEFRRVLERHPEHPGARRGLQALGARP